MRVETDVIHVKIVLENTGEIATMLSAISFYNNHMGRSTDGFLPISYRIVEALEEELGQ